MNSNIDKLIKMYNDRIPISTIVKELGIPKTSCYSLLRSNGITIRRKGDSKSRVRFNPFELGDSVREYWLGYLIADGSVSKNSNCVAIFTGNDLPHLLKFFDLVGDIGYYTKPSASGGNIYTVSFSSKEVKEYLISLGVTPNKSLSINPAFNLTRHVLRGIFDGDGSCGSEIKITTGSVHMKDTICNFLMNNRVEFRVRTKGKINTCYDVMVSVSSRRLFYNLLYADSDLYMERKKIALERLLRNQ